MGDPHFTKRADLEALDDGYQCEDCWDSGFVETIHGGIWTGVGVWSERKYCHCLCGADARREDQCRVTLTDKHLEY